MEKSRPHNFRCWKHILKKSSTVRLPCVHHLALPFHRSPATSMMKKLIIKPFKSKPQLPEDFEAKTWAKLQMAVRSVYQKSAATESKEDLYRAARVALRERRVKQVDHEEDRARQHEVPEARRGAKRRVRRDCARAHSAVTLVESE